MKKSRDILIGIIIGVTLSSMPIFAQGIVGSINVKLNIINVQLEGEPVEVESILYAGKTYLPMRKIAELVGKDVEWEPTTMTANITEKDGTMDMDSITKTHFSANDVIEKVGKTDNYDLIVSHNSNGNLCFRLVRYIDVQEGRKGDHETVLSNIPFILIEGRAYIAKEYYQQTILPLIEQKE